jgi:hypothetical protein
MSEQDYEQIYQELVSMLNEFKLGWVVEQVEAKSLIDSPSDLDPSLIPANTATPQAVLTKPAIKTTQNQLLRLIEAAERVVVDTSEVEDQLLDFVTEQSQRLHQPMQLGFAAEDSNIITTQVTISFDRRQAVTELRQLLQTLRQEVIAGVN